MRRFGVVTGMRAEARCLRGLDVRVACSGADAARARAEAASLVGQGVCALLSFGLAAGLAPDLRPGDLVLADAVVLTDGRRLVTDPAWRARVVERLEHAGVVPIGQPSNSDGRNSPPPAERGRDPVRPPPSRGRETSLRRSEALPLPPCGGASGWGEQSRARGAGGTFHIGVVAGTDRLLTTPQMKHALRDATGALAADMESHALAEIATDAGLPFLVVRAVSDPSDQPLPQILANALTADGRVRAWPVARGLLARPADLRALLRLGLQARLALRRLRLAASQCGAHSPAA